jgi:cytochrome c553
VVRKRGTRTTHGRAFGLTTPETLPADQIVQQMQNFKGGAGKTTVSGRVPPDVMTTTAKGIADAEIASAAAYFAAQKPRQAITVVETDTVAKT